MVEARRTFASFMNPKEAFEYMVTELGLTPSGVMEENIAKILYALTAPTGPQ